MRVWMKVMMAVALLAVTSIATAKPEGKGHQSQPKMTEQLSDNGARNTNSPNAGEQDKGAARMAERHALEQGGVGAAAGKDHLPSGKRHVKKGKGKVHDGNGQGKRH